MSGDDYIAVERCGCVSGICVGGSNASAREFIAESLREGATISSVPRSEAIDLLKAGCNHTPKWGGPNGWTTCPTCYRRIKVGKKNQILAHSFCGRTCDGVGTIPAEDRRVAA